MKRLIAVLSLILLATAAVAVGPHLTITGKMIDRKAATEHAGSPANIGKWVSEYAVMVGGGAGTMITYRDKVYVLSCHHVAGDVTPEEGGWPLVLKSRAGRVKTERPGRVVLSDAKLDLALIEVRPGGPELHPGLDASPLPDKDPGAEAGDECWYCGAAYIEWNLQRGVVMGDEVTSYRGEVTDYLAVSGSAWYGHSGSGVFVVRGGRPVLAGVLVIGLNIGRGPRPPAGAVPLYKVKAFLRKLK